jgi:hypothetical protein
LKVLTRLATALGRRDEVPNQQLARDIVEAGDKNGVAELVENLSNQDKNIQSDCIKVLYEIGEQKPEMISDYVSDFGKLLGSRNNRLTWGAMTALDSMTLVNLKGVYALLPQIMSVAKNGSVISRDHAIGILTKLTNSKEYAKRCLPLLLEQLRLSPDNQFPMYAEVSMPVIKETNRKEFLKVFNERVGKLQKESQKKRVEKLLRKLEKS